MTPKDDLDFLSYFIRTYIPPFTRSIPTREEEYKEIFLSAFEMWIQIRGNIDRMTISYDIKKISLIYLNFLKKFG